MATRPVKRLVKAKPTGDADARMHGFQLWANLSSCDATVSVRLLEARMRGVL